VRNMRLMPILAFLSVERSLRMASNCFQCGLLSLVVLGFH
jgi:hypothetical protein